MSKKKLTPLMEQFWGVKSQHPDKILLFRMGDFFEMFDKDAEIAAPILNIALTQRNKKAEDSTAMCGVPHHSIATPISKLLSAGYKVAICDQVEDPKLAKGLVKRAVTRILSPGMVYDPETLEADRANYLCSFDDESISFLESTTGEAFFYSVEGRVDVERMMDVIGPVEVILLEEDHVDGFQQKEGLHFTVLKGLPDLDFSESDPLPKSAKVLLRYAVHMQGASILQSLKKFEERGLQKQWMLSSTVTRHLEIFKTYKGEKDGSLYHCINRTKTSSGARMLKNWLQFPLSDKELIEQRLNYVEKWTRDPGRLKEVRKVFGGMGDIERRLGKLSSPTCHPKDILSLGDSLLTGTLLTQLCQIQEDDSVAKKVVEKIERTLDDEAPTHFKAGGVIRKGYDDELDTYIEYAEEGQKLLMELEMRERNATGIPSLKVRYNSVFGYYIEVTKVHSAKVPDHYKRKQTLANAERYLTQELQELEEKILSSRTKRIEKEEEIFRDLKNEILNLAPRLTFLASIWAKLDVFTSLAWLALERDYCRPDFSDEGTLVLKGSRHPVVERSVSKSFISNKIELPKGGCLLLTGPNMAGKSTLMRQVAISSLMAQIGSFVPAQEAKMPIFQQLFTRIGASDYLSEGLSTFMVEMKETAEMLGKADGKTLVILDEVGRGTSTYDGMSLAQAILEYLMTKSQSMVFFATHYHELTQLEGRYSQVKNAHMSIHEKNGDIEFLYTLVRGPANKSYGIQVAQLAGLPKPVIVKATQLLQKLESFGPSESQMNFLEVEDNLADYLEEEKEKPIDPKVESMIAQLKESSVQEMTPLEALNKIAEWKSLLN